MPAQKDFDSAEIIRMIRNYLARGDEKSARLELAALLKSGDADLPTLYLDLLSPLLRGVGDSWFRGGVSVWQEHLISAQVRGLIESLSPYIAAGAHPLNGKNVVLACPPEEQHDLGLRMIADLYRLYGWNAFFLGADTPVDEIGDAAQALEADLLILSAATHFHRLRLRDVVDSLRTRLPGLAIKVTGPAFAAGRDGWAEADVLDPDMLRTGPERDG
jgi:methanogenic corrinoid protein MtbC1